MEIQPFLFKTVFQFIEAEKLLSFRQIGPKSRKIVSLGFRNRANKLGIKIISVRILKFLQKTDMRGIRLEINRLFSSDKNIFKMNSGLLKPLILSEEGRIVSLTLDFCVINRRNIALLKLFSSLRELKLNSPEIEEAELASLVTELSLSTLQINNYHVSSSLLAVLQSNCANLTLRCCFMESSKQTDYCLFPRKLDLNCSIIKDLKVSRFINLFELQLADILISTEILDSLKEIKHLRKLVLNRCKINDFSFLGFQKKLKHLEIRSNPVSSGEYALKYLINLNYLDISCCASNLALVEAAQTLPYLRTLIMDSMPLPSDPFISPSIRVLSLNSCDISNLTSIFPKANKIIKLSIENAKFTKNDLNFIFDSSLKLIQADKLLSEQIKKENLKIVVK